MTDKIPESKVMTLPQVMDWLLDLHDNFNGSDPALDDFKFAAESIECALASMAVLEPLDESSCVVVNRPNIYAAGWNDCCAVLKAFIENCK